MKNVLHRLRDLNGSFYVDSDSVPIIVGGIALGFSVALISFLL